MRQRRRRPAERARARFAAALSVTAFFATRRTVRRAVEVVRRVAWVRPVLRAAVLLRLAVRDAAPLRLVRFDFAVTPPLALSRDLPPLPRAAFAAAAFAAAAFGRAGAAARSLSTPRS